MGQPQNGGDADPPGTRTTDPPPDTPLAAATTSSSPFFCMPARGNEKPDAESTVKAVQRRFATPVPRVTDLDELNRYFRQRCEAERERTVQSLFGPFVIGTRFTEGTGKAAAAVAKTSVRRLRDPPGGRRGQISNCALSIALPATAIPRRFAFQLVTVKGFVNRVVNRGRRAKLSRPTSGPFSYQPDGARPTPLPRDPGPQAMAARSTTRRCSGTGSSRSASPRFAPSWNNCMARWVARGGLCGSYNSWASTLLTRVQRAVEACRTFTSTSPVPRPNHPTDVLVGCDRSTKIA